MRTFYLRDKSGFPIATVATEKAVGLPTMVPMVVFAVSTYNPNDKFNKKLGRADAILKLSRNEIAGAAFATGNVKDAVLHQISLTRCLPEKTRKAAAREIKRRESLREFEKFISEAQSQGLGTLLETTDRVLMSVLSKTQCSLDVIPKRD